MSWLTCKKCGVYINTDDDPACFVYVFVYVGNMRRMHDEIILCEDCRYELGVEDAQAAHAEYLEEKSQ